MGRATRFIQFSDPLSERIRKWTSRRVKSKIRFSNRRNPRMVTVYRKKKTLVLNRPEVATLYQDNAPRQRQVPEKDQRKVMSDHYEGPLLEHPGRDKMIELIQ